MHRFSIDIDIIIEEQKNEVDMEKIISHMVEESEIFTHFEENVRKGNHEAPEAYFYWYKSIEIISEKCTEETI